jgi:hypothetical protein
MGSFDDIYDMMQKMEDNNIEYLLITITKGKKQGKADVFYSLKDKSSMKILAQGLKAFNKEIDKIDEEGLEGDDNE